MAYSAPQPFRAPSGAQVFLPPEIASGLVGFEPAQQEPDLSALAPSIPVPPPAMATPDLGAPLAPSMAPMPAPEQPPPPAAPLPMIADVPPMGAGAALIPPGPPPSQPGAAGGVSPPASQGVSRGASRAQPSPLDTLRADGYAEVDELNRQALDLKRRAGEEQVKIDTRSAEQEAQALGASAVREERDNAVHAAKTQEVMAEMARRSAAIDHEIDRISTMKIDGRERQQSLSLIAVAMGAIGAAMAGHTDGRNPALDMILKMRDQRVQRQMAERDAAIRGVGLKRDQLAGMRNTLTDLNALRDGLATAETRRIKNEVARLAANVKVESQKANLLDIHAKLTAEEATLKQSTKDRQFAKDKDDRNFAEQVRSNKEADRRGWAGLAQADRHFKANMQREDAKLNIEAAKLAAKGDVDGAKQVRELGIGGVAKDVVKDKDGKPVLDADGNPKVNHDIIRNRDGSAFLAGSETEAKELRAQKAAVDTINDFVGAVTRGIAEHGGESEYFKSPDWQRVKSNTALIKNTARIGLKMGTLDNGTDANLNQMLGSVDPTSFWRDASPGLINFRNGMVSAFNHSLKSQPGYNGDGYKPFDTTKLPAPTKNPDDERANQVMRRWSKLDNAQVFKEIGGTGATDDKFERMRKMGNILPSQRATMDMFSRVAADPSKTKEQRDMAFTQLERFSNRAESPEVRAYATELLHRRASAIAEGVTGTREPLPER